MGLRKLADEGGLPVAVNIPAEGFQHLELQPAIPETFGGYALILDLEGEEPLFAASIVRTHRNPKPGPRTRLRMDIHNTDAL